MITIVGSAALWPIPSLASEILAILMRNPNTTVSVRANMKGDLASGTEDLASKIAQILGNDVQSWRPYPHNSSVFERDAMMVAESSHVYAFFAPGKLMEGGTGHVAAVAMRQNIPVTAYTIDENADVYPVAEYEREELLEMSPLAEL